MSGSGPFGPILNGVWQSLQLVIVTRYWPRSTGLTAAAGGGVPPLQPFAIPPARITAAARMIE
jgi:hypothetical protein